MCSRVGAVNMAMGPRRAMQGDCLAVPDIREEKEISLEPHH